MVDDLLQLTPRGLYCELGGFYVDPYEPVERAIVTHAHSDHARPGCRKYLAALPSQHLLRLRLTEEAEFTFVDYGQSLDVGGVKVSFHPAGHILGSAQVRLEYRGRVEVVSGDYKLESDLTCKAWEPVVCHRLISECTFGLPVFRWPDSAVIAGEINQWWRAAAEEGKCCLLYGYAVGKSQRLLSLLDVSIGPIYTHGAVEKACQAYRVSGVSLPDTEYVGAVERRDTWAGALVLAVPSAHGTSWTRRFGNCTTAMASGWMMIRGTRRRRSMDRGFVISDHVDWPSLLRAITESRAESIWLMHGYTVAVARYLRELGKDALALGQRTFDGSEDAEYLT